VLRILALALLLDDPERRLDRRAGEAEGEAAGRRAILCAACRHPVTAESERIEVQGAHEHTCRNPYGFVYRFGCFRRAEGCTAVGAATGEWSWFAGHAWRIALCGGCRKHLGWVFRSAEGDGFHALVLDRLVAG
jgi:hypothetical protein